MPARVALVIAVADNGVIGRDGALPWHLPADLQHFRNVTMGKPVLMGRRTFDSIGRALPGRRNLVLSRGAANSNAVQYVQSFEQALELVSDSEELCVIGGGEIYALALPVASRLYLTQVHGEVEGDARIALPDLRLWHEVARAEHPIDARHALAMTFLQLERVAPRRLSTYFPDA